jgi:hypothetical protein
MPGEQAPGVAVHRMMVSASLTLVLAVSACGTTVPLTQTTAAGQTGTNGGTGLGQTPTGSANVTPGTRGAAPQAPGLAGGTTSGTGGDVSGSTSGADTTGGASSGATTVPNGRGVTATTITIGVVVATGTEALGNAFGVSGAGSVSEQDMVNAVVRDVNKSGGVLGRKLAVYAHSFDAAAGIANPAQTYADICADFRDDHKVFAVAFDVIDPSLRKCLADMGSPLLVLNSYAIMPASSYAQYGGNFLYGVNSITTERLAELFVQSLMARTFTAPWDTLNGGPGRAPVRLGVIHVDTPDQNALYAGYAKELARHGLHFTDTVTYTQDTQAALSTTQSAVLRFSQDGITHVFGASAFFLRDAESQHYRPRYAYLPGLGALGAANSPAAQLKGALTVGWSPASDVNAAQDPGDTPAGKHCRAVMTAAGLVPGNRTDLSTMYSLCDAVFAFRAALTAGGSAGVPGLRRGYEELGTRFGTALSFVASFGPNRHYGVDSVRDMAFDSTCGCLEYTSHTNRS